MDFIPQKLSKATEILKTLKMGGGFDSLPPLIIYSAG